MEQTTNGAGTADWLRATKDIVILAYVPGEHSAQSTVGISAQAGSDRDGSESIVVPAPANFVL